MAERSLSDDALSNLIFALQSNQTDVRSAAEGEIEILQTQHGFGQALLKLLLCGGLAAGHVQFATLLLKQFILSHWDRESTTFKEPIVSEKEKDAIRQQLPQGLAFADNPSRTAIAMAVASIAHWDFPDLWPNLLQDLLTALARKDEIHRVSGVLTCVHMIAEEVEEDHVIQNLPSLIPCLVNVLDQPGYDTEIQTKAMETYNVVLCICMDASGPYQACAFNLLPQLLEAWCARFCHILAIPLTQDCQQLMKLKTEVTKAAVRVMETVGKKAPKLVEVIAKTCVAAFERGLPTYIQIALRDHSQVGGDLCEGVSAFVAQLFDILTWTARSKQFRPLLSRDVRQLVQFSVGYMQVTRLQETEWLADVNQMLRDEDDLSYSVRTSACLFLDELLSRFSATLFGFLGEDVNRWCQEAAHQKKLGEKSYWKALETALFAVELLAEEQADSTTVIASFLAQSQVLEHAFVELDPAGPVLLIRRCLIVLSRFIGTLSTQQSHHVLETVVAFLGQDRPEILQVAACKAASNLCAAVPSNQMTQYLSALYTGVLKLLPELVEEALQEALQALKALIALDRSLAVQWQPHIAPPVLDLWAANINEPCTVMDCVEVFEDLAAIPEVLPQLQASVVPILKGIVSKGQGRDHPILVEGAIDLAATLMKDSQQTGIAAIHMELSQPIIHLICSHDDPGLLQSSCEYLRLLISLGGEAVLSQGGDPSNTVASILGVLKRLLLPEMGDSAPLYIGQVVNALLRHCPSHTLKHMSSLLPAIIQKLSEAKSSPLIVSLLSVCCELVLVDPNQLVDYLSQTQNPAGEGTCLEVLVRVWLERQLEFSGRDEIRLSCAALAALLASRHPALANVQVKGRRLDTDSEVRTRSRAKTCKEVWEQVSAPLKIMSVLADALLESREGEASGSESEGTSAAEEDGHAAANNQQNDLIPQLAVPNDVLQYAMEEGETSSRSFVQGGGPLCGLSVPSVISLQLKALAQQDSKYLEACSQSLSQAQVQAVREACFA